MFLKGATDVSALRPKIFRSFVFSCCLSFKHRGCNTFLKLLLTLDSMLQLVCVLLK